jgi:hypothetical protein
MNLSVLACHRVFQIESSSATSEPIQRGNYEFGEIHKKEDFSLEMAALLHFLWLPSLNAFL